MRASFRREFSVMVPVDGLNKRAREFVTYLETAQSAIFSRIMKVGRTIVVLLIALSIAALPAAGGIGVAVKATGHADMSSMPDMSAMEDMDCCLHTVNPCGKAMGGCSSMATCALKCFTFSGPASSAVTFPSHLANLGPAFETNPFDSQTGSPPFRPPRI